MTLSRPWAAAIFFFGMFVQLAVPLYNRVEKDYERLLLLPPLMVMALIAHFLLDGVGYDLALLASLFLTAMMLIFFINEVMPVLTKYHAAAFTALFWYAFAIMPHKAGEGWLSPWAFLFCAAASALSLFGMAAKGRLLDILKPVMYVWYLVVSAYVCLSQFNGSMLDFLSSDCPAGTPMPGPLTALLSGMMLMYVCLSVSLLYDLQALLNLCIGNYIKNRYAVYISPKFAEGTLNPLGLLVALALPTALLGLNLRFGLNAAFPAGQPLPGRRTVVAETAPSPIGGRGGRLLYDIFRMRIAVEVNGASVRVARGAVQQAFHRF